MSEVAERYATIARGFAARASGVTEDQWANRTPCPEWTVRDLVGHVVNTTRRVHGNLGEPVEDPDLDGDLVAQFAEARRAIESALADPGRAAQVVSGMFGEQSFESLVGRLLCSDTLLHTWDLARATGQDERLDPVAVERCAEFLAPMDEAIRRPGGFAPKVAPVQGADDQTLLLNFCGRHP